MQFNLAHKREELNLSYGTEMTNDETRTLTGICKYKETDRLWMTWEAGITKKTDTGRK